MAALLHAPVAKRSLTGNEKQVLYGLVRFPTLNDRELSETLGIKVSTVTAIRRRLRRADCFVTRRLPMMHRIGWEILAAGHGRLSPTRVSGMSTRMKEILGDRFPCIFYFSDSPDHFLFLASAPNFTTYKKDLEDLRLALHRAGLMANGDIQSAVLPLSVSVMPNFFDYSHVLAVAFGIEDKTTFRVEPTKVGDVTLTRKETEVLRGLVRFPEMSDKAVAQKIKASRQAVSKMRREFEETGLLRTVRLPNVRALGFELFAAAFVKFVPTATIKARAGLIEKVLRLTPQFFYAACNSDSVLLGALKSYEHFAALRANLEKTYGEKGFLAGEPTTHLGVVGMTEIVRNCEFSHLVQALMEPASR